MAMGEPSLSHPVSSATQVSGPSGPSIVRLRIHRGLLCPQMRVRFPPGMDRAPVSKPVSQGHGRRYTPTRCHGRTCCGSASKSWRGSPSGIRRAWAERQGSRLESTGAGTSWGGPTMNRATTAIRTLALFAVGRK